MLRKILEMSVKDVSNALDPSLTLIESEGIEGDSEVTLFDYQPVAFDDNEEEDIDVNIWEEAPMSRSNLVQGSNKELVSATFNKFVEFATSGKMDRATLDVTLSTYQAWTTPDKLFDKLLQRYNIPQLVIDAHPEEERGKFVNFIQLQVYLLLKNWIETRSIDFSDRLLGRLRDFVENRLAKDRPDLLNKKFRSDLAKMNESKEEDSLTVDLAKCPDPKVPKNIFSPLLTLSDVPREEIARQLTIIDNHLFFKIKTEVEFLRKNWCKASNSRTSAVAAILNRFNQLVKWVVTCILGKERYKERAKEIVSFLEIAKHLKNLQSYNSMAAIYFGITHVSVYRLSHTFNELTSDARKTLSTLSNFLNPVGSYSTYKAEYANAKPPCIPFLGAHLQDITFIEETVPDRNGDMINFTKCTMLFHCIQMITRYSAHLTSNRNNTANDITFSLLPVRQISAFLQRFKLIKNESDMYKLSLLLEPKGISTTDLVEYEESLSTEKLPTTEV